MLFTIKSRVLTILALAFLIGESHAVTVFESGKQQARLIELYTSQGCSSCPPAERWLNELTESGELWKTIVPVAFHVDYWDYLGWQDPYSSERYSNKQRGYKQNGNVYSVYTPGFVVNGDEWKGYFNRKPLPLLKPSLAQLKATVDEGNIDIVFASKQKSWLLPIDINVAVLGHSIKTKVSSGENAQRTLEQDFVVLDYKKIRTQSGEVTHTLPDYKRDEVGRYALAIWASHPFSLQAVQAVGGWLE